MDEAVREDSKLNTKIRSAVGKGLRGAAAGGRYVLRRMRMWQKAGLVLCIVFWICSALIGLVCRRITANMFDQTSAARWTQDGNSSQVSAFFSDAVSITDDTAKSIGAKFNLRLREDSIALSEKQIENGASLTNSCYCGIGNTDVSTPDDSVTVTAIGVGGDFFNFHPLELMDGYYFAQDDLMQDRVLLDDQTAWRLFGSAQIVGQQVTIGGTPHFVAGVFKRPEKRFYKEAGMGAYLIFMSYDSLCRFTESGAASGGEGTEEDGFSGSEVRATESSRLAAGPDPAAYHSGAVDPADPAVPSTAAWAPSDTSVLLAAEDGDIFDDSDDTGMDPAEEEDGPEEEADDTPLEGDKDMSGKSGGGTHINQTSGSGTFYDQEEKEEVNRSRVTCYEIILPNPVSNYAVNLVRSGLLESGIAQEQMTVVENTFRFDTWRLALMAAQPGIRSMQTAAIRYPYWENVALAWEDVLIPFALLQLFLRFSPVLFLLYLVLWYATHKSWTVGGVASRIQDRIYNRQSEKIYGKKAPESLPMEDPAPVTGEDKAGEDKAGGGTAPAAEEPGTEPDFASGEDKTGKDAAPAVEEPGTEPAPAAGTGGDGAVTGPTESGV